MHNIFLSFEYSTLPRMKPPANTTLMNTTKEDDDHPLYGDVLEEILSHVPLMDLLPALHVSPTWHRAVHASLNRRRGPAKPWLILHSQSTRHPYSSSAHAFDPSSNTWMKLPKYPGIDSSKARPLIRSSHPNFLYTFTPAEISFSCDGLNPTWQHVAHSLPWRVDPIVAKVGGYIVLAGGGCDYENDPLPVDLYDTRTGVWTTSGSATPPGLIDSAASTWLSIAADGEKERLYVMEKQSGATHFFDLRCDRWSAPFNLHTDPNCFYSVVGCSEGRLIVVGIIGAAVHGGEKVKIWEVDSETPSKIREVTEMPSEYFQKLRGESYGVFSVNICLGGGFVYIYNTEMVGEVVVCEVVAEGGGACNWGSVDCAVAGGGAWIMERFVLTCADVQLEELQKCVKREYVNV